MQLKKKLEQSCKSNHEEKESVTSFIRYKAHGGLCILGTPYSSKNTVHMLYHSYQTTDLVLERTVFVCFF